MKITHLRKIYDLETSTLIDQEVETRTALFITRYYVTQKGNYFIVSVITHADEHSSDIPTLIPYTREKMIKHLEFGNKTDLLDKFFPIEEA